MWSVFCENQTSWKVPDYAHARRGALLLPKPSAQQEVEYVRTLIYCTQLWLCGLFNWLSSVNFLQQFAVFKNTRRYVACPLATFSQTSV
jgi:hypothetical protein